MNQRFLDYYRCASEFCTLESEELQSSPGFFSFGQNLVLFGRAAVSVRSDAGQCLQDAATKVEIKTDTVQLPFDPAEVADNFYFEKYIGHSRRKLASRAIRNSYYGVRPLLPVSIRKYFQKLYFRGWQDINFPKWPIDISLDRFHRELMVQLIGLHGKEVPFVWFWPDGYKSCCTLTHDVEHAAGLDFCLELLRIDQDHGFTSSFQFVPERRYTVPATLREEISRSGYEVNVHDINHDGHLFRNRDEFLRRAQTINWYANEWGAEGFRAGSMYRNLDWISDLDFAYDMSCPNSAHLEPQRGGCCSSMPFMVGDKVELPLTMSQDYTLYHILGTYSIELWREELNLLTECNGLISLNTHPDYVLTPEGRRAYCELLAFLETVSEEKRIWHALPREVARWWRQRQSLSLEKRQGEWHICGEGSERARLAFAGLQNGNLHYRLPEPRNSSADCGSHERGTISAV